MASPSSSVSGSLDVSLFGPAVDVVRRSAPILQSLLQTRFDCEAEILGLDLDLVSPAVRPHVVPEKRLETTLSSGVKVSVWRADLANFSAEAVVNAANSRLQHFGGLALALSEAGGAAVQQESIDYVRKYGEVKTGDAVALGAGKLKCKKIIHAVGPHLNYKPNAHEVSAARSQLERAVRRILEIVETEKLDTVAIPAISSGIFNFPVDNCADAIVSTVKRFYGSSTSNRFKPKEVLLVNNDDPTVKEMEWACLKLLPKPASVPLSHTAAGVKPQTTTPALYSHAAASGTAPQTRGAKNKHAPPEVQLGHVRVLLLKRCLEEMKTDVIVNTISSDRNLSMGQVSKTLLKKAGPQMQMEIYSATPSGSVIVTKGYGLPCKEVYHVCCPHKGSLNSDQVLFQSVRDSLWLAVAAQHCSIAFPAIGTGVLGFMDREAAQIMMNAVWDFAQYSVLRLDVVFVIYPSDYSKYKAFEAELNSFRTRAFQMQPPQSSIEEPHSHNAKPALPSSHEPAAAGWETEPKKSPREPCVRLQSSSHLIRTEADTWLRHLLYNQFNTVQTVSNNFIQLLGERHMEQLAQTEADGVQLDEFLEKGRSGFIVSGDREEEVAVTALKLQQMLQEVQTQYLKEEVEELRAETQSKVQMERNPVSRNNAELRPLVKELQKHGITTLKAERVENPALDTVFKRQRAQMPSHSSEDLLQLVPAQFCNMVSLVGFRPECAPPDDPSLGEGLYFAADVETALKLWTGSSDHYLYLFVAEVIKGKPGPGRPGLVLAPGQDSEPSSDPKTRCDCVEKDKVTVIFNHRQARPKFILTCSKDQSSPV